MHMHAILFTCKLNWEHEGIPGPCHLVYNKDVAEAPAPGSRLPARTPARSAVRAACGSAAGPAANAGHPPDGPLRSVGLKSGTGVPQQLPAASLLAVKDLVGQLHQALPALLRLLRLRRG